MKTLLLSIALFGCLAGKAQIVLFDTSFYLGDSMSYGNIGIGDTSSQQLLEINGEQRIYVSDSGRVVMEMDPSGSEMIIYDTIATIKTLLKLIKDQSTEMEQQYKDISTDRDKWIDRCDKKDDAAKMIFDKYISQLPECVENAAIKEYFQMLRKKP